MTPLTTVVAEENRNERAHGERGAGVIPPRVFLKSRSEVQHFQAVQLSIRAVVNGRASSRAHGGVFSKVCT